ncbi:alpha/beta fold hydrolase [Bradyrhizobium sp.]|uniref:alpha/beta fold hydrolase n=1 Tax=Bradyrhizobium sp. TaxID=376 RepID=UPI00271B2955|nr:alpha/beta hydrolase [Bradyrhizobium sp.]MDO9297465.1 alpha/beta hydrolase [Bradyrhizobium sp.]
MIVKILRWSITTLLVLLLLALAAMATFWVAASTRETALRDELAPSTGRLVPTGSGRVFVQEKGPADGIPVVLFHGTAAWSELWRRTIDALAAAEFRVIALDLPPFGFSDRPGSYTRRDQAARVNDVLDQLKAAPAIIIGHSFGAGAATELVMRYPDRVRALVLVDAALGLTSPPSEPSLLLRPQGIREILVSLTITNPLATKVLLQSLIKKKERALPEYIEILQRPTSLRNSTPDIARWLYYFAGDDRTADSADRSAYPRLTIPVAILWGDKDSTTPLEQAHDLQTLLPRAALTVLPGLGHIPQIEDPEAFNSALLTALGKL